MVVMCSAFNKPGRHAYVYLLAAFALASGIASASDSGIVSASGTGHDVPEAITNLLKTTFDKYFRDQPPEILRSILQTEIFPNAASFVQSYKIQGGGNAGSVSLVASVDLDVLHGLLGLTPKNIGENDGAKALVMVRGAKLPDQIPAGLKPGASIPDPFAVLADAARERFARREFMAATLTAAELQAIGTGEDFLNPEFLRELGNKAGARVALGAVARYEWYENENSHNKEERLVLTASLVDVKTGNVVAHSSVNVVNPKTRKEQYLADLRRAVLEESKDLLQDIFVAAGRKLVKPEGHSEFSVVRVQFPSNGALVDRFKALLETIPGVRSVVEFSIRRGKYDFALRPAMTEAVLAKAVAALRPPDITIVPLQTLASDPEARPPSITVSLAPKENAVPGAEGVPQNANP